MADDAGKPMPSLDATNAGDLRAEASAIGDTGGGQPNSPIIHNTPIERGLSLIHI